MPEFDLDKALMTPPDWWDVELLTTQNADTTCFCPGGGGDWEPMVKLYHLCNTFVFADMCANGEETAASLRGFFERIADALSGELRFVEARELALGTELCDGEHFMARFLDDRCPAAAAAYREAVQPLAQQERWGVDALLRHGVGEEAREIRVLFLQGEASACYHGLYGCKGIAPHAVVLPPQGGRRTVRSQQLTLAGPLGAVLRAEPRPAMVLAGNEDAGVLTGTPWPHRWRALGEWNRSVFTPWPIPTRWWFDARQVWV